MDADQALAGIRNAASWEERIALIRRIPEDFGVGQQAKVYGDVARDVYVQHLDPDFAYVHWMPNYEFDLVQRAYADAHRLTKGFSDVGAGSLTKALLAAPNALLAFRLMLGFTTTEFAEAASVASEGDVDSTISKSRVESAEGGRQLNDNAALAFGKTIDLVMQGELFAAPPGNMRRKLDKPDTMQGWATIREFATAGVPLPVLLHQRLYGGAFNQLLNATGKLKGDMLEDAVADIFDKNSIPYVRTGTGNQSEINTRFGLTVRPAPDFVVYDRRGHLRAILECKAANDGGTARDKASRFRALRAEAGRLSGVPVFAVLAGIGWRRASDALGPVIRETDGRVFTPATLSHLLTVQPFPTMIAEKD